MHFSTEVFVYRNNRGDKKSEIIFQQHVSSEFLFCLSYPQCKEMQLFEQKFGICMKIMGSRNVYLLVHHVRFIAKGAGFLLQCTKCSRQATFVQRQANVLNILYTAKESCTERYGNITNQQIYFSGLTRFVHTCLGLIF